jgi:hypothetical protein
VPEGGERRSWLQTTALVTLVGAILAAAISGANLIFELWPSLKPDPKAKVGGKIENLTFDVNVTCKSYLARGGRRCHTGSKPKDVGNVFYIRAETEGFKRETVRLKWFTYDANNDTRLAGLRSSAEAEQLFRLQAPIDTQIAQVWVPTPADAGNYFVRFELYSRDILLAIVDSKAYESIGEIPD